MSIKVDASIPVPNPYQYPTITPISNSLTYLYTCLFLFPREQSMQVHDLAKDEWLLFTERKWVGSTTIYND
jgi:hypothetical protein